MRFFKCSCDCNSTDLREWFPLFVVACACPETMAITVSIAMRFPDCWATRKKKKQKFQGFVFFFTLFLSLLVSFKNFCSSFDKICRGSLETLSVLIWYAFPAFCCL